MVKAADAGQADDPCAIGRSGLSLREKIKRLTLERRKKENLRNAAWPQTGARTLSKENGQSVQELLTTYTSE